MWLVEELMSTGSLIVDCLIISPCTYMCPSKRIKPSQGRVLWVMCTCLVLRWVCLSLIGTSWAIYVFNSLWIVMLSLCVGGYYLLCEICQLFSFLAFLLQNVQTRSKCLKCLGGGGVGGTGGLTVKTHDLDLVLQSSSPTSVRAFCSFPPWSLFSSTPSNEEVFHHILQRGCKAIGPGGRGGGLD